MEERAKLTLQKFHKELLQDLILSETVFGEFIQSGIMDLDLRDETMTLKTQNERNGKFLSILPRRGPQAFSTLMKVLERTTPWLKEKLEAFHNSQRRYQDADVDKLLHQHQERSTLQENTSLKQVAATCQDAQAQTDSSVFHNENDILQISTMENALSTMRCHLAGYFSKHSNHDLTTLTASYEAMVKAVTDLIHELYAKDILVQDILNLFNESEREAANNELHTLIKNSLSEKASFKGHLDRKDYEVCRLEREYQNTIQELESSMKLLEDSLALKEKEFKETLEAKEDEIQELKTAIRQQKEEPLMTRIHNLTKEVSERLVQTENKRYDTGQVYQVLYQDEQVLEKLLSQLKQLHHTQAEGQGMEVLQHENSEMKAYGYNGQVSRGRKHRKSPRIINGYNRKSNPDNVPTSPKLKVPRFQYPMLSRQSTSSSRGFSREGLDVSSRCSTTQSRYQQTSSHFSNRQNSNISGSRPSSSRPQNLISNTNMDTRENLPPYPSSKNTTPRYLESPRRNPDRWPSNTSLHVQVTSVKPLSDYSLKNIQNKSSRRLNSILR